jgi:hypothetical protein
MLSLSLLVYNEMEANNYRYLFNIDFLFPIAH